MNYQTTSPLFNVIHGWISFIWEFAKHLTFRGNTRIFSTHFCFIWDNYQTGIFLDEGSTSYLCHCLSCTACCCTGTCRQFERHRHETIYGTQYCSTLYSITMVLEYFSTHHCSTGVLLQTDVWQDNELPGVKVTSTMYSSPVHRSGTSCDFVEQLLK
jgi:hypothetical protein